MNKSSTNGGSNFWDKIVNIKESIKAHEKEIEDFKRKYKQSK
jgi:hypothetical protein